MPFVGIGSGSAGTCFSGGSGSGGSYYPDTMIAFTNDAGIRGGAGSAGTTVGVGPAFEGPVADGGGNLNGGGGVAADPLYDGTGGVLIVFVEGTINVIGGAKHFKANGMSGKQMQVQGQGPTLPAVYPFGGGTGGGIVILVNKDAATLGGSLQALGGIVANYGPSPNYQSGGNGQAVAYTFGEV